MSDIQTFLGVENVGVLAKAIVDTVVDPLVVLDGDLRVITASRSFYLTFQVDRQETQGQLLYELGDGQWDIPKLKMLLEKRSPHQGVMEGYEVDREFPGIGRRTMLLSARKVFYKTEFRYDELSAHHGGCHKVARHRVGDAGADAAKKTFF